MSQLEVLRSIGLGSHIANISFDHYKGVGKELKQHLIETPNKSFCVVGSPTGYNLFLMAMAYKAVILNRRAISLMPHRIDKWLEDNSINKLISEEYRPIDIFIHPLSQEDLAPLPQWRYSIIELVVTCKNHNMPVNFYSCESEPSRISKDYSKFLYHMLLDGCRTFKH